MRNIYRTTRQVSYSSLKVQEKKEKKLLNKTIEQLKKKKKKEYSSKLSALIYFQVGP